MLKRTKNRIIGFSALVSLLGLLIFTVASTAYGVVKAVLDIDLESYFTETVDGYTYRCYHIKDAEGGSTDDIAVAFGGDYSATTAEDTITVPSTITHSSTTYTVKAIAEGGFRYTNFSEINIPQTVEEMREESFAYCQNIVHFSIPHLVNKIYPSTFLDCRALESIYYTNETGAKTFGNNVITEIGDHAFDSCVALRDFFSPRKNVYYGESCFQNCQSLINFYFPSTIKENNVIQNYITVRPFALAN